MVYKEKYMKNMVVLKYNHLSVFCKMLVAFIDFFFFEADFIYTETSSGKDLLYVSLDCSSMISLYIIIMSVPSCPGFLTTSCPFSFPFLFIFFYIYILLQLVNSGLTSVFLIARTWHLSHNVEKTYGLK